MARNRGMCQGHGAGVCVKPKARIGTRSCSARPLIGGHARLNFVCRCLTMSHSVGDEAKWGRVGGVGRARSGWVAWGGAGLGWAALGRLGGWN